jgi:hypothetical protein
MMRKTITISGDNIEVSDGFHTIDEIYAHRVMLFLALLKSYPQISWKSKLHSDGSSYEGWFTAGMNLPSGQISYHVPDKYWEKLPEIAEFEKGPFDGHTSDDVLKRLNILVCGE